METIYTTAHGLFDRSEHDRSGFAYFPSSLMAQTSMATLSGVVTDPSGAFVPNATVTLEGTQEKYSREIKTDSGGRYAIPLIPVGKYKLGVKASGFRPEEVSEFALDSGTATSVNVVLTLGALTEEVTVTGAPPLLDTGRPRWARPSKRRWFRSCLYSTGIGRLCS